MFNIIIITVYLLNITYYNCFTMRQLMCFQINKTIVHQVEKRAVGHVSYKMDLDSRCILIRSKIILHNIIILINNSCVIRRIV